MITARAICVFCGSSPGEDPEFVRAAARFGRVIAETGRTLVYGGARRGLMGALADAALDAGGAVIGVIPEAMVEREIAHTGLTRLHIVRTMHERKAKMAALSNAFVALPGGLGTLEELFEVWTWAQLGLHEKRLGILDQGGFFAPLLEFLDTLTARGFVRPEYRALLIADDVPERLLDALDSRQR